MRVCVCELQATGRGSNGCSRSSARWSGENGCDGGDLLLLRAMRRERCVMRPRAFASLGTAKRGLAASPRISTRCVSDASTSASLDALNSASHNINVAVGRDSGASNLHERHYCRKCAVCITTPAPSAIMRPPAYRGRAGSDKVRLVVAVSASGSEATRLTKSSPVLLENVVYTRRLPVPQARCGTAIVSRRELYQRECDGHEA